MGHGPASAGRAAASLSRTPPMTPGGEPLRMRGSTSPPSSSRRSKSCATGWQRCSRTRPWRRRSWLASCRALRACTAAASARWAVPAAAASWQRCSAPVTTRAPSVTAIASGISKGSSNDSKSDSSNKGRSSRRSSQRRSTMAYSSSRERKAGKQAAGEVVCPPAGWCVAVTDLR
ncbi:hypothetical protein CHLRE_11g481951v5 [Chlamydomonas reinhardtii]|uniref:Uncharacterized protein n=1 Tax=Chlamydomonas reinhardtii TaxID=3055 RepID=A0A2K3D8S9_CHLRE|nr:uncharacterized protein CHLRE_11g481951v5 [Chlamydomonas reinhardtii]PNW76939.1 hypothetical protein CHLRE_11g481951v5 [Chlamydomonas reinhardtii]